MIGSFLMLGSSLKNKKTSKVFMGLWILFMLSRANISLGISFIIVNIITFLAVSFAISKIKNKNVNLLVAPLAIILWSICIDLICYFVFPYLTFGQSLFGYVTAGIIFNFKFAVMNYGLVASCVAIKKITTVTRKNYVSTSRTVIAKNGEVAI